MDITDRTDRKTYLGIGNLGGVGLISTGEVKNGIDHRSHLLVHLKANFSIRFQGNISIASFTGVLVRLKATILEFKAGINPMKTK